MTYQSTTYQSTTNTRHACIDLFSGIGGNARALHSSLQTVAYCEISADARAVLKANMDCGALDRAPVFEDITKLMPDEVAAFHPRVITASFPCQDISSASKNATGLSGSRSGLFSHVVRLVAGLPTVDAVFMENSSMIKTRGLDTVISELNALSFRVAWTYMAAEDVGAYHRRLRWYCVAVRKGSDLDASLPASSHVFDFEALTSVPRLTAKPPPKSATLRSYRRRVQLLGNAVVPKTVSVAWTAIGSALAERPSEDAFEVDRRRDEEVSTRRKGRDTLTFSDGTTTLSSARWLTPVYEASHWYPGMSVRGRSGAMFATRVFNEEGTRRAFGYTSVREARDTLCLNPEWVETLMGYPHGWTVGVGTAT
jgi:site-specific DNA-cytosine methylase